MSITLVQTIKSLGHLSETQQNYVASLIKEPLAI